MRHLHYEIGTETDITEQQQHNESIGESGCKSTEFAWPIFAGLDVMLAVANLARRFGGDGSGK